MAADNCVDVVSEYLEWLRKSISIAEAGEVCEITTPFLDRHNDYLQIYVKEENGNYVLTDEGYILSDLRMSGLAMDTEKLKRLFRTILAGFGVGEENRELRITAQRHNLAQRKHSLIQCMLAINDMFMVSQPHVLSFFREDVERFMQSHHVRYVASVSFTGQTGYTYNFDFAIPASDKKPERLVRAINSPSRDSVSSFILAWNDTRVARPADSIAYAILNDQERDVSKDHLNALQAYDILPMLWGKRPQYVELLAA